MSCKKGFTLVEIIVVLIIIGILAAAALTSYTAMMQQGAAKSAENNLTTIYNAEKAYYFANTAYCTSSTPFANCGDTLPDINTNLVLNIPENQTPPASNLLNDGYFTYACTAVAGPSFTCTATNITNTLFTLTVTGSPTGNPIVLPGGNACVGGGGAPCNPVCVDTANPAYCPNS